MKKNLSKKTYFLLGLLVVLIFADILIIKKKQGTYSKPAVKNTSQVTTTATPIPTETYVATSPQEVQEVKQTGGIFLTITEPKDKAVVGSSSLQVKGRTVPGASIFINDKESRADRRGNFSVRLTLDEGENVVSVLAHDIDGNFIEKEIMVTLETLE